MCSEWLVVRVQYTCHIEMTEMSLCVWCFLKRKTELRRKRGSNWGHKEKVACTPGAPGQLVMYPVFGREGCYCLQTEADLAEQCAADCSVIYCNFL